MVSRSAPKQQADSETLFVRMNFGVRCAVDVLSLCVIVVSFV